jgi:glycerate 2-kinase
VSALRASLGLRVVTTVVTGPFGDPCHASFGLSPDGRIAVVEVAAAIGLPLVDRAQRDPLRASSRGAGELIAKALDHGASRILVGVGGTATVDGGVGVSAVLGADPRLRDVMLEVLCDVTTPFEDAARIFGPQKGATADDLCVLEARLNQLAESAAQDPRGVPMTGAGGGVAAALWLCGGTLVRGAKRVLDLVGFDRRLRNVDLVVTGEGCLDAQTAQGKLVSEVAARAKEGGSNMTPVPVGAVVGQCRIDPAQIRRLGLAFVEEATTPLALRAAGGRIAGRSLPRFG